MKAKTDSLLRWGILRPTASMACSQEATFEPGSGRPHVTLKPESYKLYIGHPQLLLLNLKPKLPKLYLSGI